eukprot:scaffold14885_cov65-Phaeocystis_antarctica.AAC.16
MPLSVGFFRRAGRNRVLEEHPRVGWPVGPVLVEHKYVAGEVVVGIVVNLEIDHVTVDRLRLVAVGLLDDTRAPAHVLPVVENAT